MKTYKKTSEASIRVLETLKLLTNEPSSIQNIIDHLERVDRDSRVYTSEVVLKYINTLKVFGFRFAKEKDKYVLLNCPNEIELSEANLNSLNALKAIAKNFPEERVRENSAMFFKEIERRFSDNTRLISHNIGKPSFIGLKLSNNEKYNQIKVFERYCIEQHKLKVQFIDSKNNNIEVTVHPLEIKYKDQNIYLSVYSPISAEIIDVNTNSIISIEQLPIRTNQNIMYSSVTFELKDRLAKVYRLREWEKLLQVTQNGNIVILNQKEDRNQLLRRLMRYGENCEVLSPKSSRDEMKNLILSTLSLYS